MCKFSRDVICETRELVVLLHFWSGMCVSLLSSQQRGSCCVSVLIPSVKSTIFPTRSAGLVAFAYISSYATRLATRLLWAIFCPPFVPAFRSHKGNRNFFHKNQTDATFLRTLWDAAILHCIGRVLPHVFQHVFLMSSAYRSGI